MNTESRAEAARLYGASERSARKRLGSTHIHCEVPLSDQINNVMRPPLPPAQRHRLLLVAKFVAPLNGRFKARPNRDDVGIAF